MAAGEVTYGKTRHFFLNGYNQTADTIRPSWVSDDPSLSVSSSSEAVGPGDIVTLSFYFNSRQRTEMGPLEIPVRIISDSKPGSPETEVLFTADLHPDFSRMTPEEVNDAPRCYAAPDRIDLGTLVSSARKPVGFRFAIRNEGKAEMRINRIFSRSEAIKITRRPTVIKGGKSAETEGLLDFSSLPQGAFNLKIEILCNDPLHPARTVSVVGIKE